MLSVASDCEAETMSGLELRHKGTSRQIPDEYVALELYLMDRAKGMKLQAPGVRP